MGIGSALKSPLVVTKEQQKRPVLRYHSCGYTLNASSGETSFSNYAL